MASPEILRIPVGQKINSGGSSIEAVSNLLSSNINPGETEMHEATHAVVALATNTGVESASVIPGDGYLGITKLTHFNAVAAVAPHAMGHDGTAWDLFITESQGHGIENAASVGRSIANSEHEVITEVAAHLQVEKILSGSQIGAIREDVKRGEPVTVTRTDAEGNVEIVETRAENGIVMFPSRMYHLEEEKAA